jgi:adenylate cyclase
MALADLIAQGKDEPNRWRRTLPEGEPLVLGREAGTWAVPWDPQISRKHAELSWRRGRLEVRRLPTGRNPIYLRGQETDRFELRPGEHFVIGGTAFTVASDQVNVTVALPRPVNEQAYSSQELKQLRFRNADHRFDVLNRLPDVIAGAATKTDLFVGLVSMLLSGLQRADAIALIGVAPADGGDGATVRVLHWDRRPGRAGDFHPSERLILEAMRRQQSVLHIWGEGTEPAPTGFTASENIDWAFCTPVRGEFPEGWAIYVAGRLAPDSSLSAAGAEVWDPRDDLKFTQLVAAIVGALRQVRALQKQRTVLGQFFSPVVLDKLAEEDPDTVLAPRQTEVSVAFCDLRGFSRESEKNAGDLMGLLERVGNALGVMTHHILENGGVIGDFQGDSAMGFWGWPLPQGDAAARACLAALAVGADLEAAALRRDTALCNFRMGIGIATGVAVAGRIGTRHQAKVSVFGPVVNLASRLEGLTKIVHGSILLDEPTAQAARQQLGRDQARFRRVAIVRPCGLSTSLTVTELLPPIHAGAGLGDDHLARYEEALETFLEGRWHEAFAQLSRIAAPDEVKDYLMVHIARHNLTPPQDWDGVIAMTTKS